MEKYREKLLPNYDMETAILEKDENRVTTYARTVTKYAINLYRQKNYSALENWMETEKLISTYCLEIIKKDAPVQYSAGFLAGVLKVVEVIVKENYKQLNIGECLKTIEWENIPHVAQILEVIYKNPRIQHARLAEMIDISSATLTGIMKRMTDAGMVEFIRSGKFKYYILTRVGTTYYLQNRTILEQNVILNTKAFEKDRIFAIEEPLHIKVTWINDSTKKHLTSGRKIMRDSGLSSVRIDNENISNYVKCVLGNI